MSNINEIIEKLDFLVSSAKERNVIQGIQTFSNYIEILKKAEKPISIFPSLYRELCGMQRFADFTNQEWEVFKELLELSKSY